MKKQGLVLGFLVVMLFAAGAALIWQPLAVGAMYSVASMMGMEVVRFHAC